MEKYSVKSTLRKNSHSEVLLVVDPHGQERVLKWVNLGDTDDQASLRKEVALFQQLCHPHIIAYKDSFETPSQQLGIVMEYASSGDLDELLRNARKANSLLAEPLIIKWIAQVSLAVQYLHARRILHRDIKPQNIFVTEGGVLKLGDFGISKQLEHTYDMARTQTGTPYYLSPEVCQNDQYNYASDIWMLGCVFYEMVTLSKPFRGHKYFQLTKNIITETPEDIPDNYSIMIQKLINSMLQKNPQDRPTIGQILEVSKIKQAAQEAMHLHSSLSTIQETYEDKTILSPLQPMDSLHHYTPHNQSHYQPFLQNQSKSHEKTKPRPYRPKTEDPSLIPLSFKKILSDQSDKQQKQSPDGVYSPPKGLYSPPNALYPAPVEPLSTHVLHSLKQLEQQLPVYRDPLEDSLNSSSYKMFSQKLNISINTDNMEPHVHQNYKKTPDSIPQTNTPGSGLQQSVVKKKEEDVKQKKRSSKTKPKQFSFADQIFNSSNPVSPNRRILFTEFIEKKLGRSKFKAISEFLDREGDPLGALDTQRDKVLAILGDDNADLIKIFRFLISSSATPPQNLWPPGAPPNAFSEKKQFRFQVEEGTKTPSQRSHLRQAKPFLLKQPQSSLQHHH